MSRTHHHGRYTKSKPWVKLPAGAKWFRTVPSRFTREFMNRPKRHENRRVLSSVVHGKIDADAAAFPVGSGKPEVYFW